MMMLRIASYEFRYQFLSLQTAISLALFFGLGFLLTANGGEFQTFARGGNIFANAPYTITDTLLKMSIFSIFVIPFYIATSVLKDRESHFDAILFSTGILKGDYLFGRFLGAFSAFMAVFAGAPLGMLLGTFWPWADSTLFGPTNLSHYLIVYWGFVLPTLLAMSAIIFAIAVISRDLIYTYLAALGLLILYMVGSETELIAPLWDPSMYKVFENQTQYWTAVERNASLISYSGTVLINRAIWFGIALLFGAFAFKRFSFQAVAKSLSRKKVLSNRSTKEPVSSNTNVINVLPTWTTGTAYYQFLERIRFEVIAVLKSVPFLVLLGLCTFMFIVTLLGRPTLYGVNTYPLTRLMVESMGALIIALIGIMVFYSADIIWREKQANVSDIMDALPAPNWVFIVSKLLALGAVMLLVLLLGVAIAMSIQILEGHHYFEVGLYLERGLFYLILPYLFLAILNCFFQVLFQNRYIGMLAFGIFLAVIISSNDLFGFSHPLFSFGIPGISAPLSDMNGSGYFIHGGYWLRGYWAAIAGLLLMLTYQLWNRGTLQPLKVRLSAFSLKVTPSYQFATVFLLIMFVGTGGYIYYNTNVLNDYINEAGGIGQRTTYEKKYRQFEHLPMPRTTNIKINVDLYPYQRKVEVNATQTLTNKTQTDINEIHLVFPPIVDVISSTLEGAQQKSRDDEFNYYIYALDKPMLPGEELLLTYETRIHKQGFPHRNPDFTLVRNGTFVRNKQISPYIGFNPGLVLRDKKKRKEHGLDPLPARPALEDTSQYHNNSMRQDSDFIQFETTVSTVASQVAISSGRLDKEWVEGDRRYFTYKSDEPMRNFYSYLSAEYTVARDTWQDVDIEVFHHPAHTYNIERMINSVRDSLEYFSQAFGPYQYKQVRVIEFPAYSDFAQSFSNMIPYSESMGFVANVKSGDIDMPYYVTAHEVAHQWWGHQVVAANTQGDGFINETLSQYSALLVMEKRYGKHHIRQFLKYELDAYLEARADDHDGELPLHRVEKQPHIYYRKGAIVMYALRDYLGEDVINRVLERLISLRAYQSAPYATTLDFLGLLKEESAPEFLPLIEDMLERITLYDVKVTQATTEEMADGRFKINLVINAAKFYADAIGNETQASFDIPVDIGLFERSPDEPEYRSEDVIFLEKRRVLSGISNLTLIVEQRPQFVGIDPYNKLIDRNSDDNVVKVCTSNCSSFKFDEFE